MDCDKCKFASCPVCVEPCASCTWKLTRTGEWEKSNWESNEVNTNDDFTIVDYELTDMRTMVVTFKDGTKVEVSCSDSDEFDYMTGFYVAIAKKACPNVYAKASKGVRLVAKKAKEAKRAEMKAFEEEMKAKREEKKQKAREEWLKRHPAKDKEEDPWDAVNELLDKAIELIKSINI